MNDIPKTAMIADGSEMLYLLPTELFQALHSLEMLGTNVIVGETPGYGCAIPTGTYKVTRFETLVGVATPMTKLCGNVRTAQYPLAVQETANAQVIVLQEVHN